MTDDDRKAMFDLLREAEAQQAEREEAIRRLVERLRDATRNREAFATNAVSDLPLPGSVVDHEERAAEAMAKRDAVLRPVENAALRTLADGLRACNYDSVFRAIEEAGAAWLYPIMLDRALETLAADEGEQRPGAQA